MPDLSSCDLLQENQTALLARLSIFEGGCSLEAFEHICAVERAQGWNVLDSLAVLTENGLIIRQEGRYQILETVHDYARMKLTESGKAEVMAERHRDYFLALAEEAVPKMTEAEQGEWLCRLDTEYGNCRSALSRSLQRQEDGPVLRFCAALYPFWRARGYIEEGRQWCEAALQLAHASAEPTARASVVNAAGVLARLQQDYAAALAYHNQSLAIRRELGDKLGVAASLNGLGNVACDQGDYDTARRCYEESLFIKREMRNQTAVAGSLNNLGFVAYLQGDYPAARHHYKQSLALRIEAGNMNVAAVALLLQGLAEVSAAEGAWKPAASLWAAAEALREQIGLALPSNVREALQQGVAATRQALGEVAFSTAWAKGRSMTLQQSIEYALARQT